jgi:hypothetical protein
MLSNMLERHARHALAVVPLDKAAPAAPAANQPRQGTP